MSKKAAPAPAAKAEQPAAPQNDVTLASRQEPLVRVPDNPVFGDTPDLIREGLAAMEGKDPATEAPKKEAAPVEPDAAPQEAAPGEEAPAGPSAKGWAAVKIAEKKLRAERSKFENERQAGMYQIQQMRAEIEALKKASATQSEDIKAAFAKDAFGTLKSHFGVTLNDLAQMALNEQSAPPVRSDDQESKVLREKLERLERTIQERDQQAQVRQYQEGIAQTLADERFELLQTMPNAANEVFEVARGYAQKTGQVLPPDKAAGILLSYWERHLSQVSSHKAARRVLGLPDSDDAGANNRTAPRPKGPKKTLPNQLSSPPPARSNEDPGELSEHEELMRAAKLIPEDAWSQLD